MLDERRENISQFADGIKLFAVGLAKKVLIANQMGVLWDTIRGTSSNGIVGAWIGIISYAFQIYFDFRDIPIWLADWVKCSVLNL